MFLNYSAVCPRCPRSVCLAVSRDARRLEKYDVNPILSRGEAGSWDEGAIWFTTVKQVGLATLDAPWFYVKL